MGRSVVQQCQTMRHEKMYTNLHVCWQDPSLAKALFYMNLHSQIAEVHSCTVHVKGCCCNHSCVCLQDPSLAEALFYMNLYSLVEADGPAAVAAVTAPLKENMRQLVSALGG
jgi:hypothetical protein